MANSVWQANIQNAAGDIVPGAEITVIDEGTGLNAVIFSSKAGAALTNPFNADAGGFSQFYSGPGEYRVTAFDIGTGLTQTFDNIRLGDAGARDTGILTGQIPTADESWNDLTVEYGTNANGEFWKYPDGSLKCIGSASIAVSLAAIVDGTNFSDQLVATFPLAFISPPNVVGTGSVAGRIVWGNADQASAGNTTVVIRLYANAAVSGTGTGSYIALGRWA